MEPVRYVLRLDMTKSGRQATAIVKQGDLRSRKFWFRLTQGGQPYPIPQGCLAVLRAQRPDGTLLYEDCGLEQGLACYLLSGPMSAVAGRVSCELNLYDAGGQVVSSPAFELLVERAGYPDTEISATNSFTALSQAMTRLAALEAQVESAESARAASFLEMQMAFAQLSGGQ